MSEVNGTLPGKTVPAYEVNRMSTEYNEDSLRIPYSVRTNIRIQCSVYNHASKYLVLYNIASIDLIYNIYPSTYTNSYKRQVRVHAAIYARIGT